MTESKNTYLPEQGEIDRTKIKGYSLRIGAFTSWVKENGYTTSQIAARLNMKEEDLLCKLKEKQLFNREQLRILIRLMGASSACFVIYFPTFELRQQVYFEVFGKELAGHKKGKSGGDGSDKYSEEKSSTGTSEETTENSDSGGESTE